jgi:leucyl/phenylalanyl-tRNA--protein transferase
MLYHYAGGIFPLGMQHERHLWWSLEPRAVLQTNQVKVNRTLRKVIRRGDYVVRADTAFDAVVELCRLTRQTDDGPGSWITDEYVRVFRTLHRLGHAHSIETWRGDQLAGGLFGVAMGQMFYGCSMFRLQPNASKVALVALARQLDAWGFPLVDCQIHNPHLGRMGARLIPRMRFHEVVRSLVRGKRRVGSWADQFQAPGAASF